MNIVEKYEKLLGAKTEVLTAIPKKYNEYKSRAGKKGIEFKLTRRQFDKLCKKKCHYCKVEPINKPMGIDRVNNHRGYYFGNIVPCCWTCNRAKADMDPAEFDEYLARIKNDVPEYIKIEQAKYDWLGD